MPTQLKNCTRQSSQKARGATFVRCQRLTDFWLSWGVIPERTMDRAALAAGVLGGLTGGLLAVRRIGRSTLLVGAGVGAILFLVLLSAGLLLFEDASVSNGGVPILLSCLCGGAMAGILGSRPKKKRKR